MKQILRKIGLLPQKHKGKFPYQFDLQKCCPELSAELAAPVQWQKSTNDDLRGETAARFRATPGALKWHHYFEIYDELFAALRNKPISLLEIGVYKGASTSVWKQYFHTESRIVGIDIDPACTSFANASENVHVRIGPQQDQAFLSKVVNELGPFDLIIDDGSHIPSHMITSFNYLFPSGLKNGGLYFVEDTHTNFWPGYRDTKRSFMDFAFGLVECMHAHYTIGYDESNFRVKGPNSLPAIEVPKITTLIQEIRFHDSVVAIRKASSRPLPQSQHW